MPDEVNIKLNYYEMMVSMLTGLLKTNKVYKYSLLVAAVFSQL
jgi:hypothetical protein